MTIKGRKDTFFRGVTTGKLPKELVGKGRGLMEIEVRQMKVTGRPVIGIYCIYVQTVTIKSVMNN